MERGDVEDYLESEKATARGFLRSDTRLDFRTLYPEYGLENLRGPVSTSLEPYSKIWELVPYRQRIIVHIIAHHPTEEAFRSWYGVSVEEMIDLERRGMVSIMLTLPSIPTDVPSYLDPFFDKPRPSSARLHVVSESLSPETLTLCDEMAREFASKSTVAIDTSVDETRRRPYATTRVLAIQLASLGFIEEIVNVRTMIRADHVERARRLLELLRLFYVGPSYYSLNGLHNISWNSIEHPSVEGVAAHPIVDRLEFFHSNLARIMVRKLRLYRPTSVLDSLDVFRDYESTRLALSQLDGWLRTHESVDPDAVPEPDLEAKVEEILRGYDRAKAMSEVAFWASDLTLAATPVGWPIALTLAVARGTPDIVAKVYSRPEPVRRAILGFLYKPALRTFFDVSERALKSSRR